MDIRQIIEQNPAVVQHLKNMYFSDHDILLAGLHKYILLDGKKFKITSDMPTSKKCEKIRSLLSISGGSFPARKSALYYRGHGTRVRILLKPTDWFDIDEKTRIVTVKKGQPALDMHRLIMTLAEIYTQQDFSDPKVDSYYKWLAVHTILGIIQFGNPAGGSIGCRIYSKLEVTFYNPIKPVGSNELATKIFHEIIQPDKNWIELYDILLNPGSCSIYGLHKDDVRTRILFALAKELLGGQVLLPDEYPNNSEVQNIILQIVWNNDKPKQKNTIVMRLIDYSEPIAARKDWNIEMSPDQSDQPEGHIELDSETALGIIYLLEYLRNANGEENEE